MDPYYADDLCTIYHGDAREVLPDGWANDACVVVDPPWTDHELARWIEGAAQGVHDSALVFTDGRRIGAAVELWGPPSWAFVWDTMSGWTTGPRSPVQQTKLCLWYGEGYERDAELYGETPRALDYPSTRSRPLDGRRLRDLYAESLRWLHNPRMDGSAGSERFNTDGRRGDPVYRHAKPVAWVRMLVGNTSRGRIVDPCLGSGTALRAAKDLGRRAVGVDIDERCCEVAALRLAQEVLDLGDAL